jgi:hypothetical protein
MATPQITNHRTRLYFDREGAALGRLLGEARPTIWMRGAERLPELAEAQLLATVAGAVPNILLWAVSKISEDPNRSFRYFPRLGAMRVAEGELMAITGLGSSNRASHIDIANGNHCDPQTFKQFVGDSTFSRLSGVIFGPAERAQDCVPILSASLENWGINTGAAGERELLHSIDKLRALSCSPIVCIRDSDTRDYWAMLLESNIPFETSDSAALFATSEEFARWERIGWDVRSLNRSSP